MNNLNFKVSLKRVCLLAILVITSSCLSIKTGAKKTGKTLYESFYVAEGTFMYFLKPLSFESDNSNALFDFTFHYKKDSSSNVDVKFSLLGDKVIKQIDSLKFESANKSVTATTPVLLFNERKKTFVSRFSSILSLPELSALFSSGDFKIDVYAGGNLMTYKVTSSTRKNIKRLNDNVFVLF